MSFDQSAIPHGIYSQTIQVVNPPVLTEKGWICARGALMPCSIRGSLCRPACWNRLNKGTLSGPFDPDDAPMENKLGNYEN